MKRNQIMTMQVFMGRPCILTQGVSQDIKKANKQKNKNQKPRQRL